MKDFNYNCMPCMPYTQVMGMQNQCYPVMGMHSPYSPMIDMQDEELEKLYPKVYHIVYPHVKSSCDKMVAEYGDMCLPTREQLEKIAEEICCKVEADVVIALKDSREPEERQLGFGGRRLLGNLVTILFIRDLLGRRRRIYGVFPGFYGSPGYFGGYPYY